MQHAVRVAAKWGHWAGLRRPDDPALTTTASDLTSTGLRALGTGDPRVALLIRSMGLTSPRRTR